jgi:nucleoside-triphosphatase THEP1
MKSSGKKSILNLITMPGIIVVSGPIGSGKTQIIKYMCRSLALVNKIHHFEVFCPSMMSNDGQYDFIPERYRHTEYNEPAIIELLDNQAYLFDIKKTRPAMLILDDCIGTVDLHSKFWDKLLSTCRHPNLTVIVVTQYLKKLPPILRENARTVIILRTISDKNLEALYETCGSWKFENFKIFKKFVMDNTTDFKCIFVQPGKSIDIVRAPSRIKPFRINF